MKGVYTLSHFFIQCNPVNSTSQGKLVRNSGKLEISEFEALNIFVLLNIAFYGGERDLILLCVVGLARFLHKGHQISRPQDYFVVCRGTTLAGFLQSY